jgi:hypothetical protein
MHSTYLFERFHDLYPTHVTLSPKPATVNVQSQDESDLNLYDVISEDSRLEELLRHSLSPIQKVMLTRVFNGANLISYDADVYNCTPEEFEAELDGLRTTMTLCGLEG